ncbi:alpha-amylase family protein [Megamonas hypermegale]|uniref:alpha-amylase family protein n=1 Tax=Megamonas hypermegale TaxID=158847 RepID=UPI0026F1A3F2|nr:alpha-amylase family protein [Megamonas hypermegale]
MGKLENKEDKTKKMKKTKKTAAKTVKVVKKAKTKTEKPAVVNENVFSQRLHKHYDELKWLYCELYQDDKQPLVHFDELMKKIKEFYIARPNYLKALDIEREQQPDWYKGNKLLGMMMYVNCFSGTLKNFEKRLPYIQESNVNYLHLMPLLSSPKGKSDGGYAVADFRSVQEDLGTMKDLENLAEKCHENGISVCLDFVMNHTSDEHEWARKARSGDKEYQDRYFFFDDYSMPELFERDCPQVFPTTAPGNFTYLSDINKFVMTTFYPYQWDLDYRNPVVFNEMVYNMLFLVNQGIDIIRLDAVPYIWKQLGTNCRNLPQVHTIVRMMRMISEIVSPAVLLLGEVVMAPDKVVPYFGTPEKPECHMLYNVTTMATTWHTVATRDTALIKHQMDILSSLPKQYIFQNYLRCHDDIGWGLDYDFLRQFGIDEAAHKKYLNDFFTGKVPGSFGIGELYNDDERLRDARLCGTTASLCGIEYYDKLKDKDGIERSIQLDLMLHAFMLSQSGIPVIYSGDEIGQYNDYSYKEDEDADKRADSRYVHRGVFNWRKAGRRKIKTAIQAKIYQNLAKMEKIRSSYDVFKADADMYTLPTWEKSTLAVVRETEQERFIGLYNFSENEQMAWINETDGLYTELLTDTKDFKAAGIKMAPYSCLWLWRKK